MSEALAKACSALDALSPRQREIAQLVANGRSNSAIALELVLSERTVEHHVTAILHKLDLSSRAELIAAVFRDALQGGSESVLESAPRNNLPLQLTSFVGRESEIAEVAGMLKDHRLVTFTGSGGVGKTRAALQIGSTLLDEVRDGVWFAELAPIRDGGLVPAAIAQALGLQEVPNRPLFDTLLAYLKKKSLLLILDNCEHVIAEAARVADSLLRCCAGLRIIATSREPLRVAGEHTYRLPSLATPSLEIANRLDAADAAGYGAIALFVERARAVDHRFALSDETAPIVAEICRRLDGISLAIELAAARVKMLPIRALAKKLDHRFGLLTGGDRTALPRHQTMRALIDWSYDLLSAPEQRLFERLSVFAGGCTLATAIAVCIPQHARRARPSGSAAAPAVEHAVHSGEPTDADDDVFELLSSLVDKSLVEVSTEGNEPRYRLLESVREYARERLEARGDLGVVAHRHALVYLDLAEELERACDTDPDWFWRERTGELDNFRAALAWALLGRGDVACGQRLVGALNQVWAYFAELEGRQWIASALELGDERTSPHVLAKLDYAQAAIAHMRSEVEEELASSEQALSRYRELGDELGVARALSSAGHALWSFGRNSEAEPMLCEAVALGHKLGNDGVRGYALRVLALVRAMTGDFARARCANAEALAIYVALDAHWGAAMTTGQDLAFIEYKAADAELALRHATRALPILRTFNDPESVRRVIFMMSEYLIALGRYDEVAKNAWEAFHLVRDGQLDGDIARPLQYLGFVAALQPRGTTAHKLQAQRQAARVLGFADDRIAARTTSTGWKNRWGWSRDRVVGILRDALGAREVADLMAEGAAMTEDQAIEAALGF